MSHQPQEEKIIDLLSLPRFSTYIRAANNSYPEAWKLYCWTNQVKESFSTLLGFVEIALRNKLDRLLPVNWALPGHTPPEIYKLLQKPLQEAQKQASKATRYQKKTLTNDDVIAQLSFGVWSTLIGKKQAPYQVTIWDDYFKTALENSTNDREKLGRQLDRLRLFRNRIAHHDNLLNENLQHRLNDALAVLARLDKDFPSIVLRDIHVQKVIAADPRRAQQQMVRPMSKSTG